MRATNLTIYCAVLACVVTLAAAKTQAADKLSDVLRESEWDGLIGTWVDADTVGANLKISFAWKIADRVIEVTSKDERRETVALMGVNAKTGEVFHVGADSEGTSVLGTWDVDENGDAVLGIAYTSGDGEEGQLSVRYHREGIDTVMMTIELPQPIKVKLIRAK
jgi:hypothetical protein